MHIETVIFLILSKNAYTKYSEEPLQQPSFCIYGLISSVFAAFYLRKMGGNFELRHSKADRECSRGLSVENFFGFYFLRSFFLGIMGFQPSFLLLHPPLFEVEPQRQKQQFDSDVLLSGC